MRSVKDVELDTGHFDHKTQLDIVATRVTTSLSPSTQFIDTENNRETSMVNKATKYLIIIPAHTLHVQVYVTPVQCTGLYVASNW